MEQNTTKILHNTTVQVISLVTKTARSLKNYVIISFPVWYSPETSRANKNMSK